jgi:hypothetical protein
VAYEQKVAKRQNLGGKQKITGGAQAGPPHPPAFAH